MSQSKPKRKASDVDLPAKGDDPAERKRVLNVLAQRRYRQRRKEHVQKLEKAAKSPEIDTAAQASQLPSEAQQQADTPPEVSPGTQDNRPSSTIEKSSFEKLDQAYPPDEFDQITSTGPSISITGAAVDPFAYDFSYTAFPDDLQLSTNSPDWQLPWLPRLAITIYTPIISDFTLDSRILQDVGPYDFPDEANLEVLELVLLRGATSIASRLGILPLIWSLDSVSPFSDPLNAFSDYSHLPKNLQPTPLQRSESHHPIIDLLPWPTVRDKLILIFSVPPEMRPGSAAKPSALVDFVYDVEDSAEGVRIWGDDPYNDRNWEVGEKVYNGWWWAFDTEVIDRSNRMRERRGARLLGHSHGSVLGEVT